MDAAICNLAAIDTAIDRAAIDLGISPRCAWNYYKLSPGGYQGILNFRYILLESALRSVLGMIRSQNVHSAM